MGMIVEIGVPTGWPVRLDDDYEFGLDFLSDERPGEAPPPPVGMRCVARATY